MFNKGLKILKQITEKGFEAFLVGGCVRDLIMEIEPHDIDISTNCPVEVLETLFKCHEIGNSKSFGIVAVVFEGETFEIAQFREDVHISTDGKGADSVVITNSFKSDVTRRDFTINGMGIDLNGQVVDLVDGITDISNGIVRTIGNPFDRFNEDFVRVLRAVRFAGKFGFDIEEETSKAIMSFRHHLITVAPERIKGELFKMASDTGEVLAKCIEIMDFHGILEVLFPELERLKHFREEERFHPEAYKHGHGSPFCHTIRALRTNKVKDPLFNLSVLFHDLGKGVTHQVVEGMNRFHGHDFEGVKIFNEIAERLKFSTLEKDTIVFSINHHMKLTHVSKMRKSKVARLTASPFFEVLKNTIICDDSCREGVFDEPRLMTALEFAENVKETFITKENKLVVVTGHQVMELLNIKPSKVVGHIINEVTDKVLDSEGVVCIKRLVREAFESFEK